MLTRRRFGAAALGVASSLLQQTGCSSSPEPETSAAEETQTPSSNLLASSIVIDLHCDTPILITAEGYDLGQRHDYAEVDIPPTARRRCHGRFLLDLHDRIPVARVGKAALV